MKKILALSFILLAISLKQQGAQAQQLMGEKEAFLFMLKNYPDLVDSHAKEYLFRFEKDSYYYFAEDEFELKKAEGQLGDRVENVLREQSYYVESTATFGTYNFDDQYFEFLPIPPDAKINIQGYMFAARGTTNTKIDLAFLNGLEITQMPMDESQANYLIKLKKSQKTGKVERKVHVRIKFKMADEMDFQPATAVKSHVTLYANIIEIEVYDNEDFASAPLVSIPTSLKTGIASKSDDTENKEEKEKDPDLEAFKIIGGVKYKLDEMGADEELQEEIMDTAVEYYDLKKPSEK